MSGIVVALRAQSTAAPPYFRGDRFLSPAIGGSTNLYWLVNKSNYRMDQQKMAAPTYTDSST